MQASLIQQHLGKVAAVFFSFILVLNQNGDSSALTLFRVWDTIGEFDFNIVEVYLRLYCRSVFEVAL